MRVSFKIDILFTPTFGDFTVNTNISYSYCQVEKEGQNFQHQNEQEDTEVMRIIFWKVGTPNAGNKFVVEAGGGGLPPQTWDMVDSKIPHRPHIHIYRATFVQRTNMLIEDRANDQFQIRWRAHLEMEARHEATNLCYLSLSPASINEEPRVVLHPPTYPSISPCVSFQCKPPLS